MWTELHHHSRKECLCFLNENIIWKVFTFRVQSRPGSLFHVGHLLGGSFFARYNYSCLHQLGISAIHGLPAGAHMQLLGVHQCVFGLHRFSGADGAFASGSPLSVCHY